MGLQKKWTQGQVRGNEQLGEKISKNKIKIHSTS